MKRFHFAGYGPGGHGDQIEIIVHSKYRVEVSCWNDGYPDPMGAGGYSRFMPAGLVYNYNQDEFIKWLKENFGMGYLLQ